MMDKSLVALWCFAILGVVLGLFALMETTGVLKTCVYTTGACVVLWLYWAFAV